MTSTSERWLLAALVAISVVASVESGWTPWGPFSACSRSCGGGVKYRERLCVLDRSGSTCKGKNKVYKMCNTQECEGTVQDFRAAQCEEFNNEPLSGVFYKWKPYYGHGETCELQCFASGFPFYHKLADNVLDGTPCGKKSPRLCIQGTCMSVGCDKKIGSTKVLDMCGVCGGDNSSCSQKQYVNGIYDVVTLSRGYSTVIEIPVGATNITVRELDENRNPLAFWDSAGNSFAIDAETRKLLPTHDMAGAVFIYSPLDYQNRAGKVQASGPINSKVTVYLVNQGAENPGIEYSYTTLKIPSQGGTRQTVNKKDNSERSKSLPPSNIQVSMSNVPSQRRRNAIAKTNVRIVHGSRRSNSHRTRPKIASENKAQYVYGNGVQIAGGDNSIRKSDAKNVDNGEKKKRVTADNSRNIEAYTRRSERLEPSEDRKQSASMSHLARSSQRYVWTHGRWTECSNKCGSGYRRRSVSCIDRVERTSTDEKNCFESNRPQGAARCNNGNCMMGSSEFYVRWQVGSWGQCSRSCDLGEQSQSVFCQAVMEDETTKIVDDEMCLKQYNNKPQYRRSCNEDRPCSSPERRESTWTTTAWSRCSVSCGEGIQTRRVSCRNKSHRRNLPSSSCRADTRPTQKKRCLTAPCEVRQRQTTKPAQRNESCRNSYYGCCPDGVTSARGVNGEGCRQNPRNSNTLLAKTGSNKILPCGIKPPSSGEYLVQWRKDDMQYPVFVQYSGYDPRIDEKYKGRARLAEGTSLQIYYLKESDSGFYQCSFSMVDDYEGTQRSGYRLHLEVRGEWLKLSFTHGN